MDEFICDGELDMKLINFVLLRSWTVALLVVDVIFVASRRMLKPPKRGSATQRPHTRTLTTVHEAILEDVVLPAEIVEKRIRYKIDGSKIMKVFLDPKERNNTEYKLESFSAVYRKVSGKDVVFDNSYFH